MKNLSPPPQMESWQRTELVEEQSVLSSPLHRQCVMCGTDNPIGFKLRFSRIQHEVVETTLSVPPHFQGYNGIVHGGIVASLLDSAMTNCLLAEGIAAVTGDLNVRYKLPVPIDTQLCLRGFITETNRHLYNLKAELWQERELLATATARFVKFKKSI